jgi:SAM-dependent methyltransferase
MASGLLPTLNEEKTRYEEHLNDVTDIRYQNFVSPIVKAVKSSFPINTLGLDYGSGTGPVISKVLGDDGYQLRQFDPIFCNDLSALQLRYDYIVCCEVIEHFHAPAKEFELLKSLLKPNGALYCMTHLYTKDIEFGNWYYKNDNTHVFIYQCETLFKIKDLFKFSSLTIEGRLIIFKN